MGLPIPILDDRTFQELVALALRRIPETSPEWTDHNLSDPGITFLELFGWLSEIELFRIGRVDDRSREAMMALVGAVPLPAKPARVDVRIVQNADERFIPAFEPLRPNGPDAPWFVTQSDVLLTSSAVARVRTRDGDASTDRTSANDSGDVPYAPFGARASTGVELELVLDPPWRGQVLRLHVRSALARRGSVVPRLAWSADGEPLVAKDCSEALRRTGEIELRRSAGSEVRKPGGAAPITTVRCRIEEGAYDVAPSVFSIATNVVPCTQVLSESVKVGRSDGTPDQVFSIPLDGGAALLERGDVLVEANGVLQRVVSEVDDALPDSAVVVLDRRAGSVRFGNGLNGRVPPAGAVICVTFERTRGTAGMVNAGLAWSFKSGELSHLVGANAERSHGARDPETIDALEERARLARLEPARAVTLEDYARIARTTREVVVERAVALAGYHPSFPSICLAGHTTVVVLTAGWGARPAEPESALRAVRAHLDAHRLIGERVHVLGAEPVRVDIMATVVALETDDPEEIRAAALAALAALLDPYQGGPARAGWPLGRDVHPSEIAEALTAVRGVRSVREIRLARDGAAAEGALALGHLELPVRGKWTITVARVARGGGR